MHLRPDGRALHQPLAPEDGTDATTRRGLVRRLSLLLGGAVALGLPPLATDAKRKKGGKKKKKKPLKAQDWDGFWNTRLSSGVSGTVNLSYDNSLDILYGTYSNSVGNGELRCYAEDKDPFSCFGRYDQTDGSSGNISMELTSAKFWSGTYQIDEGEGGTWSGVR